MYGFGLIPKGTIPALYTEGLSDEQRKEIGKALDPHGHFLSQGGIDKARVGTDEFDQWQIERVAYGWIINRTSWSFGGQFCANYTILLNVARQCGGG